MSLDMPFALAIAHRGIARLHEPGTRARQEHIDQARALFRQCGATKDAKRLEEMFKVEDGRRPARENYVRTSASSMKSRTSTSGRYGDSSYGNR
jgi:hypothetical protein